MSDENRNVYKTARQAAGLTQEQAAEAVIVSVESIRAYETGQRPPGPGIVVDMADAYHAPELRNRYCTTECPIGCINQQRLEVAELDRLTVRLMVAFQRGSSVKNTLLDITEDGVIDTDERPKLDQVIGYLDGIAKATAELKLWAEKNL